MPLVVVSVLLTVGSIHAQQSLPIRSGQRVRITAPECGTPRRVATFEEIRNGALVQLPVARFDEAEGVGDLQRP